MTMDSTIYISSPGLTDHDQIALQTAIKLLFRDGQTFESLDEDVHHAHLLVLDGDNAHGKSALAQSLKGQVKVVFSSTPKVGANVIAVKKPVRVALLTKLLSKLFTKMQIQILQRAKSRQNETLFHVFLKAKENKQILRIGCPHYPDLLIDGLNRSMATSTDFDEVRELFQVPIGQLHIEKLSSNEFSEHTHGLNITTLHNLLWMAGIECSGRNLLPGHSLNSPVKLRAWPNFTRNDFKPDFLKLAAILARQAVTLSKLSEMTNIPEQDVVSFYNAAYAVDLIERNVTEQKSPVTQREIQPEKTSLFAKIAQRLTFRKKVHAA